METSMARLSSGKRINSASDDAAGVAISSRLSAEIRGTDQAIRNALDGQALIDTAEGAHSEIENILQRMREISVQAANDTNNDQDRKNLQAEITALVTEIGRIADTTTWAGENLMEDPSGNVFSFQVGAKTETQNQISITIDGMRAHELGLEADPNDLIHGVSDVAISSTTAALTANISSTTTVTPSSVQAEKMQAYIDGSTGIVRLGSHNTTTGAATITLGPIDTTDGTSSTVITNDVAGNPINLSTDAGVNLAVAAINAGTDEHGVYADVVPSTEAGGGQLRLAVGDTGSDGAAATSTHAAASLGEITFAQDTANSHSDATMNGDGVVTFNQSTATINLGQDSGANFADVLVTLDSTNLGAAADLINAQRAITGVFATFTADAGTGFLTLSATGNDGNGTAATSSAAPSTVGELEFSRHGKTYDTSTSTTAVDGTISNSSGTFTPAAGPTSMTLTLGEGAGTDVSITGLAGDQSAADLQKIVDAITASAGSHGYSAQIGTGSNAGKVELTPPTTVDGAIADGMVTPAAGMFTSATGPTSMTLTLGAGAGTDVSITGLAGDQSAADLQKIVDAITASAGSHGYSAQVGIDDNAGKVVLTAPAAPTKDLDVTSASGARDSIEAIDAAVKKVNMQRSKLGAVSNRLSHTINNLTNISTNLSAAQGGIEDADFAHETTMLAKNQILQQASTAMLAQANASKQNVLSLLQG
jgi:flagellin